MDRANSINMRTPDTISEIENPQTNEEIYRGSVAAILQQNLGLFVICEFLIGTENIVSREGILYNVGINFITLYQEEEDRYVLCDLYSLKFVTIYDSTTRPRSFRNNMRRPGNY